MISKYTGFEGGNKAKSINKQFVLCFTRNLNIVLNDSVKYITEMIIFYDFTNKICLYCCESHWSKMAIIEKKFQRKLLS